MVNNTKSERMMKKLLFLFFIFSYQTNSFGMKNIWNKQNVANHLPNSAVEWLIFGTCIGITSSIFYYTLTQCFNYYFSARSYYNSAKKIRDAGRLDGIEDVQSFEEIIALLKNNSVARWRHIVYSDCYVVDVYHFIQKQLHQLSMAEEYLMTARSKKDFDAALLYVVEQLEYSINHLHDLYVYLRSICEAHPLFSRHMMMYHQRKCTMQERKSV